METSRTLLNEIGDEYNKFKQKISEFDGIYDSAVVETKNLDPG